MRLALLTAALLAGAPLSSAAAQITASHSRAKPAASKTIQAPGGPATPQLVTFAVGGNDSCSSASSTDAISGYGTFAVNNTGATAGSPVGTCGLMGRDVWFYWTAPVTEMVTVSTCGLVVGADPVSAIWADGSPAGTCPTTEIVCLDDSCGVQQAVQFAATAGTSYFIELGSYNGGAGYNASFSIAGPPPPVPNDSCTLPINLVGDGPHPFNTVGATTGAEGQTEALCLFFGGTDIFNDVWYTWTATTTGLYELTLCNGTTHPDTRLAVYSGAGCPAAGSAIACNDDSCGLISALCFSATAGQTYLVQIGAFGPGQTGTGNLLFTPLVPNPSPCAPQDDGSSENSVGLTAGGALAWMVGYGQGFPTTVISAIDTCFGTPLFPGGYVPTGPVTIGVWDDPNDDGDISDGVFVTSVSAAISPGSVDTDAFQSIPLPSPLTLTGIFFVGAVVTHSAGEFPGPLDQSGGGSVCSSGVGSWVAGNTSGAFDFNNLLANDVPPQTMASVGLPGNWLLRIVCCTNPDAGVAFCCGDGTGTVCPCGNNCSNVAGNCSGCCGSQGLGGRLNVTTGLPCGPPITGGASISNDTVRLLGVFMPSTSTALYFQGTTRLAAGNGVVFGDGLRCAGGTIIRLGTKTNSGGASQYPGPGDPTVSVKGLITVPGTRTYQIWYRNAAAFCTSSTFNLSNGYEIVWSA